MVRKIKESVSESLSQWLDYDKVKRVAKSKGLSVIFNDNFLYNDTAPYKNLLYGEIPWYDALIIVYKNYKPYSDELKEVARNLELDEYEEKNFLSKKYQLVGSFYLDKFKDGNKKIEESDWCLFYKDKNNADVIERDSIGGDVGDDLTQLVVNDLNNTSIVDTMVWLLETLYY